MRAGLAASCSVRGTGVTSVTIGARSVNGNQIKTKRLGADWQFNFHNSFRRTAAGKDWGTNRLEADLYCRRLANRSTAARASSVRRAPRDPSDHC